MIRPIVLALLAALAVAADDPLAGLAALAKPRSGPAPVRAQAEELSPGVRVVRGAALILDGSIMVDQGPVDGLEVLACLREGKTHEALVRLTATSGAVVKAGAIAALGLPDGQPSPEQSGLPARGTPVALLVEWTAEGGERRSVPASCLVRDRPTDRPFPALPWVYTGSRFETVRSAMPDGTLQVREQFMLDTTRSVAVNFDEPDALLGSPFPSAMTDARFEVNSALCPPAATRVELVIAPCTLPLTLDLDAAGVLHHGDTALDDAALRALLIQHYAPERTPAWRAVGVRVEAATPRSVDVAARTRIMTVAAGAAWVVPAFSLR